MTHPLGNISLLKPALSERYPAIAIDMQTRLLKLKIRYHANQTNSAYGCFYITNDHNINEFGGSNKAICHWKIYVKRTPPFWQLV